MAPPPRNHEVDIPYKGICSFDPGSTRVPGVLTQSHVTHLTLVKACQPKETSPFLPHKKQLIRMDVSC